MGSIANPVDTSSGVDQRGESRQRRRLANLESRCKHLEAERARLERLLASALVIATRGTTVPPLELLALICECEGVEPARAAVFEERIQ